MSDELDISPEAYDIAASQVDDSITYFRLCHYLSRLNYIEPITETKNGALVVPRKMLYSVAYGFSSNDDIFFMHFTGILFDFFKQLMPVKSMFVDDGDNKGIVVMMKPIKYADYTFPPLRMFFPIAAKRVFERAKASSGKLCIAHIEQSLIDPKKHEVTEVAEGFVEISSIDDFLTRDNSEENYLGIYS